MSEAAYKTRLAALNDWRIIRDLRLSSLSKEPEVFCAGGEDAFTQDAQWQEYTRARIEDGNIILIAYAGEEAAGMAGGKPNPYKDDAFILHSLWVEPGVRNEGIAKLLCTDHAKYAQRHGYKYVQACCMATNVKALHFHRRLGYVEKAGPSEFRPEQTAHEILFYREISI